MEVHSWKRFNPNFAKGTTAEELRLGVEEKYAPGWHSPVQILIEQVIDQSTTWFEEQLLAVVRDKIGFEINKSELIRALKYDRAQYAQGYLNGRDDGYEDGYTAAIARMKAVVEGWKKNDKS